MRSVTAPDGSEHSVRIEWIGNRLRRAPADIVRRIRRQGRRGREAVDAGDAADGCMAIDGLDALALLVGLVVLVALVWFLVLPAAWGLLELVVLVILAALVWTVRVLFRRPWSIVHRGPGDEVSDRCAVIGWRRAHATMVAAADEIAATGSARSTFGALTPFGPGSVPGADGRPGGSQLS